MAVQDSLILLLPGIGASGAQLMPLATSWRPVHRRGPMAQLRSYEIGDISVGSTGADAMVAVSDVLPPRLLPKRSEESRIRLARRVR